MTLGERIRQVRSALSQEAFSQKLGVSLKTVQRYELDKTSVDAGFLQALCQEFPVNPAWLLTGVGPMLAGGPTSLTPDAALPTGAIDQDLMDLVATGIDTAYREEGGRLQPLQLVRETARFYDDLVAAYDSDAERRIGLQVLLQQLRRDLKRTKAGQELSPDKRLA